MKNRAYAVILAAVVALMAASGASAKNAARHSVAQNATRHSVKVLQGGSYNPGVRQLRRAVRF
jgi:hypothetical protein